MPRLQLIELEDEPWFPSWLRKPMQEYLEFMANLSSMPLERYADRLAEALRSTGDRTLIDLCSGGSGPVPTLVKMLGTRGVDVTAKLTDLYPNAEALGRARGMSPGHIDFVPTPVDAANVPAELKGFRTIHNAFHHLPPHVARGVLEDAAKNRQGIAVLEVVGRHPLGFLNVLITICVVMMLVTPFVKPFRLSRLLLTYVVPLIPLCSLFDGLVSCARVYSPAELKALTDSIAVKDYVWEMGLLQVGNTPANLTYLVGRPV